MMSFAGMLLRDVARARRRVCVCIIGEGPSTNAILYNTEARPDDQLTRDGQLPRIWHNNTPSSLTNLHQRRRGQTHVQSEGIAR